MTTIRNQIPKPSKPAKPSKHEGDHFDMKGLEGLDNQEAITRALLGQDAPPKPAAPHGGPPKPAAPQSAPPKPRDPPRSTFTGRADRAGTADGPNVVGRTVPRPAATIAKHVEEQVAGRAKLVITDVGGTAHTLEGGIKVIVRMRNACAQRLPRTNSQAFNTAEFESDGYEGPWFACCPASVSYQELEDTETAEP